MAAAEESSSDTSVVVMPKPASSHPPPIAAVEPEMAQRAKHDSTTNPSWFTPRRLLVIFCIINLLNYVDRGVIASNGVNGKRKTCNGKGVCTPGSGIQGDFNLTNFQDGLLSSAFMVGLLVGSPIFASLAKSVNPFRLVGVGLSVWTLAAVGCGASVHFWMITVCRMVVGVGEASFISLAAPFIDDNAPVARKTLWLSAFYMCMPTGVALGYVYGGVVGDRFSWRVPFLGEAALMLPFAILGFCIKPLQLKGFASGKPKKALTSVETAATLSEEASKCKLDGNEDSGNHAPPKSRSPNQFVQFGKDMKALLLEKVFIVNVLGYVSYNFVIGAYSYWGPKAGYNIYGMKSADLVFGGVTCLCGVIGTLAGGYFLDRIGSTLSNGFKILAGATFLGATSIFAGFCLKSMYGFIALFAVGELLVFATQAPVNYLCLHCIKPSLRPLSMAMSTVAIHVFGDVPSSPLVGVLQDHIHNWRKTALILTSILFLAATIWFIGIFMKSVDRFNEESEDEASPETKATVQPCLKEEQRDGKGLIISEP